MDTATCVEDMLQEEMLSVEILPEFIDNEHRFMVHLCGCLQICDPARLGKWLTVFGVILLHRLQPAAAPARCFLLRRLGLCLQSCLLFLL